MSEAERLVLDSIESAGSVDLSARPAGDRRIGASFLQALISGSEATWPRPGGPLSIRGADISGALGPLPGRPAELGLATLVFRDCTFDSPVDLGGSDFLMLRFIDCTLPALVGASLTTKADLDLSGSCFTGVHEHMSDLLQVGTCAVHLCNARIGGRLVMRSTQQSRFTANGIVRLDGARVDGDVAFEGALLDGLGDVALSARSATVGGNVELAAVGQQRFEAVGEVALVAAHISGDLNVAGARLHNPGGRALHCEDLNVESVFLSGRGDMAFEANGRLNFLSATVGGSLFVINARLIPGPDYAGLLSRGGPVAINLQQVRISNSLVLNNIATLELEGAPPKDSAKPVEGWFLLAGAQMNGILDTVANSWPAPGYLDLESATYERIRSGGAADMVAQRIRWLRLQFPGRRPTATTFRPQPYEELTRVLRRHGQSREADAIAVEKIRMRLAAKVDPFWARVLPRLLMLVSLHGYSSSRAVLSFFVFVVLGAAMYSTALWGFGETFLPFEHDPEPVVYVFPFDLVRATAERGCPGLDVFQYALDVALPLINLGQDTYCRFAPEGPLRWFWSLLHSVFALAGTALSAVAVLTLTGVLRRD
ncbi:MAG: hypothetical protein P8Y69_11855 [Gammaproteobacteria bacterium]